VIKLLTANYLIKTKFFIPGLSENLIEKCNVFEKLNEGLKKKLTIVSAPAGFGKTTFITQWLNTKKNYKAWLSLDIEDNNLKRFLAYLISALQGISKIIGEESLSILRVPEKFSADYAITMLINDIADFNQEIILILDDFHLIAENDIHKALNFFINNLPANFHLYIVSRIIPENLSLSMLRAKNNLIEITAASLRFEQEEIIRFFKNSEIEIDRKEASLIEVKTEGWILALQMLLLSIKESGDKASFIRDLEVNNRYIVDYLIDEILSQLNEEIKDFLLKTSILSKFNISLCKMITEKTNAKELLNELEKKNLFLIPLDNKKEWYRYHNLFKELLFNHLAQDFSGEIPNLHKKASQWYEEQGLTEEAIIHSLTIKDYETSLRLIEIIAPELFINKETKQLYEWFRKIPENIILSSSKSAIYYATILSNINKLAEAEAVINKIEEKNIAGLYAVGRYINQENNKDLIPGILCLRANIFLKKGNHEKAISLSHEGLNLTDEDSYTAAMLNFNLGVGYTMSGLLEKGIYHYQKHINFHEKNNNYFRIMNIKMALGRIYLWQGALHKSEELFLQILEDAKNNKLLKHPVTGTGLADLAYICYQWNELEKANLYMSQSLELSRQAKTNFGFIYAYSNYLEIKINLAETENIEDIFNEIKQFNLKNNMYELYYLKIEAYKAQYWILKGKLNLAEEIISKFDFDENSEMKELEIVTATNFYLIKNDLNRAELILEKMLISIETFLENKIKYLLLKAFIFFKKEKFNESAKLINDAFNLGEKEGFIRIFVDFAREINSFKLKLLKENNNLTADYKKKLLSVLGQVSAGNPELLSKRELEILQLINEGFSNQEIIDKLFLSLSTVKTHIQSIFRKLEAKNRTQALAQAKKLEIL
jgi:LuxR family maltose regulon positive regulatory protein